jgi:O-antigen/teichoic acid export membrane protein
MRLVSRRLPANVVWSGVEAATSGLLSFASVFLIAGIIGPGELGVGAAAVAPHILLWVGVNALFADAIVQRATIAPHTVSSAFWASLVVGCAAAGLQVIAGIALTVSFADPRLRPMSLLLAAALPVVGAAGPVQGLLTRERRYRILALRAIVGQGLGTLVGIGLALNGAGGWALVVQQFTVSVAGAGALLIGRGFCPQLRCHWHDVAGLLRIGLPLTASTLLMQARYRLFALAIGAAAGPAALGQVHLAFRLVDSVRELMMTALWRLMLPGMAACQHDRAALLVCVDRQLGRASWVVFPACGGMFLVMAPVVALLLAPVWQPSGQAALPLIGLMVFILIGFPGGIALIAGGQPKYALFTNLAGLLAVLLGVALFQPATPLAAVAVWCAAQLLTNPYNLVMNARRLAVGWWRPMQAGLPALLATAAGVIAAWTVCGEGLSPVSLIATRGLVAALVFLPLAWWRLYPAWRLAGLGVCLGLITSSVGAEPFTRSFLPDVPGFDTSRGVTVLSRLRPEFTPPGVRVGSLILNPSLQEGVGYDSNLLGSAQPSGSLGIATQPALLLRSDWGRHSLGFYVSLENRLYPELLSQNQTNWNATLGGGIDIGHDRLILAAAHQSLHETNTDFDAVTADAPINYQIEQVRAAYASRLNRWLLTPEIEFSTFRYDRAILAGNPQPQRYRNRDVVEGGVTLSYALTPERHLLLVTRAASTRYIQPQAGAPTRNSSGFLTLVGLDNDLDGLWRYRLLVGFETRNFVATQYSSHIAPIAEAAVIWNPSGLTTVTATLSRSIEDAAQEGVGGYVYTTGRVAVDHEYLRNILLAGSVGYRHAAYTQGGGSQGAVLLGSGATWLIDRNLRLSATYALTLQTGAQNQGLVGGGDYTRNVLLLTLRYAL